MKVKEGSGTYNVVIIGSLGVNPGFRLVNNKEAPQIAEEYMQSYRILRGLACDVPLGSHPAMYNLAEKYPKIGKGANPFIDPDGYKQELDTQEELFQSILAQQKAEKIL
jgi:metallo-beta-lactamase class B